MIEAGEPCPECASRIGLGGVIPRLLNANTEVGKDDRKLDDTLKLVGDLSNVESFEILCSFPDGFGGFRTLGECR